MQPHPEEPRIILDRTPGPSDVVQFGGTPTPPQHWRRLVLPAIVVAALVFAGVGYAQSGKHNRPTAGPTSPPATAPRASSTAQASAPESPFANPSPQVSEYSRPILGITAGWELYGRTLGTVLRIQFAAGRVTQTTVPHLDSDGPVSFLATPTGAVVRPLDFVAGYLVPDGQPSQLLGGMLAQGGEALPGPQPGTLWVPATNGDPSILQLVDVHGAAVGGKLQAPTANHGTVTADGSGYAVYVGTGGVYAMRPEGTQRIATGSLVAVGPTRWLVQDCDDHGQCGVYAVDKSTGARHGIPLRLDTPVWPAGVISPDGTWAAVVGSSTGSPELTLINLDSGEIVDLNIVVQGQHDDGSLAWSPDSQWLFATDQASGLHVIQPGTRAETPLGLPIPALSQIAIRPAP